MTKAERACQIWSVLAWAAKNRQTLTYGHLDRLTGIPAVGMGKYLDLIQGFCLKQKLPPLTILVVQSQTGIPGPGFTWDTVSNYGKAQKAVFEKDWLEYGNPQPGKFVTPMETAQGKRADQP